MQVKQVEDTMRSWVTDNAPQCLGLYAAHLVGSMNRMADEALFPDDSDVDFHLILAADSPALKAEGPLPSIDLATAQQNKWAESRRLAEAILHWTTR